MARLKSAVDQAVDSSRFAPENIRDELNGYLKNVSDIVGSLRRNQPAKLSQVYLASSDADSSALETLPKVAADSRIGVVREVRDDLQIKVGFFSSRPVATTCQTYAGHICPLFEALPNGSPRTCYFAGGSLAGVASGGEPFGSVVRVTVETERNGKQVNGLWVRCNPYRDGVTKYPMFVFNSATSPTTSQLPPGVFTIWVEATSGGKVLIQRRVDIGVNRVDHETITLEVP